MQGKYQGLLYRQAFRVNPTPQIRAHVFHAANMLKDNMWTLVDVPHQPRMNDMRVLIQMNPCDRFLLKTGDSFFIVEEAFLERFNGDRFALVMVITEINNTHAAEFQVSDFVAPFNHFAYAKLVFRTHIGFRMSRS